MIYKRLILRRIASIKRKRPGFKQAGVASLLGIEPSYLSRFLSDSQIHFSDELLFSLLKLLEFSESEVDHLMTLKEYERTLIPERKRFLEARLKMNRIQSLRKELEELRKEALGLVKDLKLD